MPWQGSAVSLPEEWWDRLRDKERIPKWWNTLVEWGSSFPWTHMHTQTFRQKLSGWESAKRYSRFLAEHRSSWMLSAALWAVEPHPKGHGSHIHSLWSASYDACATYTSEEVTPLYRLVKQQSVQDSLGFSRLWPIDDQKRQVAAYCLKYVVKGLTGLERRTPPLPWEETLGEPLWNLETWD